MNIETKIAEAIKGVDLKNDASIQKAANKILSEDIKAGQEVAIIDDPTWSCPGTRARVKGPSGKDDGWMNVELENGTILAVQSSLLIPV
jgi:hypothetical protein